MNVNIPFILLSEGFILHERVLPRDGDILPRLERIDRVLAATRSMPSIQRLCLTEES